MPTPLPLNPDLKNLPVYQPGRPIEEVARELGLPAEGIIKMASNENPFGPSPLGAGRDAKGARRRESLSRTATRFISNKNSPPNSASNRRI